MTGEPTRLGDAAREFIVAARARAAANGGYVPRSPLADDVLDRAGRAEFRAAHAQRQVPRRFATATATEPQVCDWIADTLGGGADNLLILGTLGTGKTHQAYGALRAIAAADALHGPVRPIEAWHMLELFDQLRPGGSDPSGLMRRLSTAGVLLLDDVAAEKPTDWTAEKTLQILNARYEAVLPTIITSNLGPDALMAAAQPGNPDTPVDPRVASRLLSVDPARLVFLTGPDRRLAGFRQLRTAG
jgi:DNA replication protein DnaC